MDHNSFWSLLSNSKLSQLILESQYGYPIVEIAHIFGFVIMIGSIAMLDIRLLGYGRSFHAQVLSRYLLPWTVFGFGLAVVAGVLLFMSRAPEWVENPVFQLKCFLLLLGGLNALLFHLGPYRSISHWDTTARIPATAKLAAAISLLVWFTVLACGRLLAYFNAY